MFIRDFGLQFSFCVLSLSGFGIRVMVILQNVCSLPLQFLKVFQKDRHQLFSKCLIEFSCEAIWSWAFFAGGRFLITASISVLVIGLFMIFISSWFNLGRLNFSKNLSRLSFLLPYSCSLQSVIILCISSLSLVTSPYSFLILLI